MKDTIKVNIRKNSMKIIQIGVIGSMADLELDNSLRKIADEIGKEIAKAGAILLFGLEGDFDSLSLIAAKSANSHGGKTIAFIWGSEKPDLKKIGSLKIVTGQNRGGGREFPLILSCDAIISLGGGSGTLMEIAMAYQAGIPIITVKGTGGWSAKLANKFLDNRKRFKIIEADNPTEAVALTQGLLIK